MRRASSTLVALALFTLASQATANGRYPAAGQIVVDPHDPDHIVVRGTFGFITSRDRGQTWSWICEGSVGYGGEQDPAIALTGDGSLLAGVFEGLAVSRDECAWKLAGGGLHAQFVIDVSTEKQDPARAVAITATPKGGGSFVSQLWASTDHGDTWQLRGELDPSLNLLTVDVAPSDPNRLYASGIEGGTGASIIARSNDGGVSWTYQPIAATDDAIGPFLSAIDPDDPNLLYLRLRAIPVDRLLVSQDAGTTWTTAFHSNGTLLGFALSPDGTRIALGGSEDGIWTAPTTTLTFNKVSTVPAQCLTWTHEGLYACGKEEDAAFTIGHSQDGGATFTPVMHLAGVCGILSCSAETAVAQICPAEWPLVSEALSAPEPCEATNPQNPDNPANPTEPPTKNPTPETEDDDPTRTAATGCNTTTPNSRPLPLLPLFAAAALYALTRRRTSKRAPLYRRAPTRHASAKREPDGPHERRFRPEA